MDPAVKRTQEKLWLGGLLWWSLLLQLVYGGKNLLCVRACAWVCVCLLNKSHLFYDDRYCEVSFPATTTSVYPGKCYRFTPHLEMVKLTIHISKSSFMRVLTL